jgi:hypothetical protein
MGDFVSKLGDFLTQLSDFFNKCPVTLVVCVPGSEAETCNGKNRIQLFADAGSARKPDFATVVTLRVARFFLVQHTKTGKNIPNYQKIHQM